MTRVATARVILPIVRLHYAKPHNPEPFATGYLGQHQHTLVECCSIVNQSNRGPFSRSLARLHHFTSGCKQK